jgi:hypothetical protein
MDEPKYTSPAVALDERKAEDFDAGTVYQDLRSTDGRSLSDRKQIWLEKYEGRWVLWEGEVTYYYLSEESASKVTVQTKSGDPYSIEVYFDPLENGSIEPIENGDRVTVSGKLWGYYFLDDTIRLADGLVVHHTKAVSAGEAQIH